jgi:aminoglycoside phosphotransferase (APT) family kinase protein
MSIDLQRLSDWLDGQGISPGQPITDPQRVGGGTQNILIRFHKGEDSFVVRRPPVHKRASSDDAMRREARVLSAIAGTDVPHARLVVACDDVSVLGAAFYVMEAVDGVNLTREMPPAYRNKAGWRHDIGLAIADTAARIAEVDYERVGLVGFGKPEGYLQRQLGRWRAELDSFSHLDGYGQPQLPHLPPVERWLDQNLPERSQPGLMHGDFHLANVLVASSRPDVAAVIDWELATIGDPLLDLGWLLATWPDHDDPLGGIFQVQPWHGFPTPGELVDRYAARTTRDVAAVDWYTVLACYKLAVLLEGTFARARAGLASVESGERAHHGATWLLERASAIAQ